MENKISLRVDIVSLQFVLIFKTYFVKGEKIKYKFSLSELVMPLLIVTPDGRVSEECSDWSRTLICPKVKITFIVLKTNKDILKLKKRLCFCYEFDVVHNAALKS